MKRRKVVKDETGRRHGESRFSVVVAIAISMRQGRGSPEPKTLKISLDRVTVGIERGTKRRSARAATATIPVHYNLWRVSAHLSRSLV